MHPAVFLDLDNTIVHDTAGVSDLDALSLIKGAAPAIASFRGLGYRIVVVANHEGVARGKLSEDDVQSLHARVAELVRQTANGAVIDAFYYCPFHPKGQLKQYKKDHPTRKPRPGMLLQAAEDMTLDLAMSWMIGDELADVQAGHAAGARTILLRPDAEQLMPVDPSTIKGITSEPPDHERPTGPDFYAVNLVDAARLIAQQPRVDQADAKPAATGRRWDAEKIAKIQIARPASQQRAKEHPAQQPGRAFRPWGAPGKEDDEPIVAKPFRKRQQADEANASQKPDAHQKPDVTAAQDAPTPTPDEPAEPTLRGPLHVIPENIRQAIARKKQAAAQHEPPDPDDEKTLRLILHELRAQRGTDHEFSFLTIIAVALQLVALICLLGGLFMGGEDDGLFLRWLGAGLMVQLTAIATLLYGR